MKREKNDGCFMADFWFTFSTKIAVSFEKEGRKHFC